MKGQRKITRSSLSGSQRKKGRRQKEESCRGCLGVLLFLVTVQLTVFQAEKHTYTNSNLLQLKIEPLNRKCQAQGRVTCLAGPDSSPMAPIIPTPSRHI